MKRLLVSLGVFVVFACLMLISAQAAVIVLNSGKTVEGEVIEETSEYIKIEIMEIPIKYYKDEIKSIDGAGESKGSGSGTIQKGSSSGTMSSRTKSDDLSQGKGSSMGSKAFSAPSGKLSQVYESSLSALGNNDLEALKEVMCDEAIKSFDEMASQMGGAEQAFAMAAMMSPKNVKYTGEMIEGDKATLTGIGQGMMGGEAEVTITFKKEDNKWKVDEIATHESN